MPGALGGDEVMIAVVAADGEKIAPGRPGGLPHRPHARLHGAPLHRRGRRTPRNTTSLRLQKHVLRDRGVTAATWDREQTR
ncbi:hypothetical protein ACU686_14770 [Yinghuangia aomiensis]